MSKLEVLWERLEGSYWFIPAIMLVASILLASATLRLDNQARFEFVSTVGWIYSGGPDGARDLLSTLAGSLITVTGTIFSVVIVAFSIGSSQFGPRLLINFARDRSNQFVLGVFIGTFAYCLWVLRSIRAEDPVFVPYISVNFALVLGFASLVAFIYFIHHGSTSINAESVIAVVSRDLDAAIERLFPNRRRYIAENVELLRCQNGLPDDFDDRNQGISSGDSGYLQAIDQAGLLRAANERDLVLHVLYRPGEFVMAEADLLLAYPDDLVDDELAERLRGYFMIGSQRMGVQDVEFALNQLVELAVRALSPSTNDPFTAMSCISRLGDALTELAERSEPATCLADNQGKVRVVFRSLGFPELVGDAFNLIRQYANGSVPVITRLMETLVLVAANTRTDGDADAVWRQAVMTRRLVAESIPEPLDRERALFFYRQIASLLERNPEEWNRAAHPPANVQLP